MMTIRDAAASDTPAVAGMLARAFADDPAMSYIFPDPDRRATGLPRLFAQLFAQDRDGMRLVSGKADAATLWRRPGRPEAPLWSTAARAVPLLAALGPAVGRALRLSAAIAEHFPVEPFWYLHIAGVDPAQQGKGLGGASIRAGLARADATGVPCYLETATEKNLGLYAALGFELVGDWRVPGGGPPFWSMRRAAARCS